MNYNTLRLLMLLIIFMCTFFFIHIEEGRTLLSAVVFYLFMSHCTHHVHGLSFCCLEDSCKAFFYSAKKTLVHLYILQYCSNHLLIWQYLFDIFDNYRCR